MEGGEEGRTEERTYNLLLYTPYLASEYITKALRHLLFRKIPIKRFHSSMRDKNIHIELHLL